MPKISLKTIVYCISIILLILYNVNETHFYFKKKTQNIHIIKVYKDPGRYGKLLIEFNRENQKIKKIISIRRSVFDKVHLKTKADIYYDDFLIEDVYFVDKHPYFLGKLILNYLILVISISPILINLIRNGR